jgi:pyrimidine and pyridine-specific 5'-nucleotidase
VSNESQFEFERTFGLKPLFQPTVWDWRSGNKIVRFGQQSNVSLGISIVDNDKIVAVTVDGIIRTFSIVAAKLIAQFDLHKLGGRDLALSSKLAALGGSTAMLQ